MLDNHTTNILPVLATECPGQLAMFCRKASAYPEILVQGLFVGPPI